MTDIVMVSYNRKAFVKEVLEHLRARTPRDSYRLIVVDNASTDGTRDLLRELFSYKVATDWGDILVEFEENKGLEYAKNYGWALTTTDRVVDTDNDCLVPPGWLADLNALMDRHPEFAAISLRPQLLVGVGKIFDPEHEVAENNVAGGSFRLMDAAAVRSAGGWRNEKGQNRSEEWHICGKLRGIGKKVGYARDLFTYHMFGEDHAWGYGDIDHKHGDRSCPYVDSMFPHDPETMIPTKRHNE